MNTHTHTLTGGEARCEVDELLHELAEAELGKQVTVTGAAVKNTDTHLTSCISINTVHYNVRQVGLLNLLNSIQQLQSYKVLILTPN